MKLHKLLTQLEKVSGFENQEVILLSKCPTYILALKQCEEFQGAKEIVAIDMPTFLLDSETKELATIDKAGNKVCSTATYVIRDTEEQTLFFKDKVIYIHSIFIMPEIVNVDSLNPERNFGIRMSARD